MYAAKNVTVAFSGEKFRLLLCDSQRGPRLPNCKDLEITKVVTQGQLLLFAWSRVRAEGLVVPSSYQVIGTQCEDHTYVLGELRDPLLGAWNPQNSNTGVVLTSVPHHLSEHP